MLLFFFFVRNHLFVIHSYSCDGLNLSEVIDSKSDAGQRLGGDAKKRIRKVFEENYRAGKFSWFFSKLRF